MNEITSFKGREIDYTKPVRVFRNLTRKGRVYSIYQFGKTVAHTTSLLLINAKFIINEKGQQWVRTNKRKQVHAFIEGMVSENIFIEKGSCKLLYNPFENDTFVFENVDGQFYPAHRADQVLFGHFGVKIN